MIPDEPTDDESTEHQALRESQVRQVLRALTERKEVDVPEDELEPEVRGALAELEQAPVQDFVTVLVERIVRERLRKRRDSPPRDDPH